MGGVNNNFHQPAVNYGDVNGGMAPGKVVTPAAGPVAQPAKKAEAKEADSATRAQSEKNQQATKSGAQPTANPQLSKIEKEQVGLVVQAFNAAYQGIEKGPAANALAGNELAEYMGRNEKLAGPIVKQLNSGKTPPDWGALVRDTKEPAKTFIADKAWPGLSDDQKKGVVGGLMASGANHTAAAMIMADTNAGRNVGSLVLEASRSGLPLPALLDAAGPPEVSNKLGDFMVGDLKGQPGVQQMFDDYGKTDSPFRQACDKAGIGPNDLNRLTLGVVTPNVTAFFTDLEAHPSAAGHAAGAILLRGEAGGAEALKKIDLTMAEQAHTPEAKAALEADAAKRQTTIDKDTPVAERMEKRAANESQPRAQVAGDHVTVGDSRADVPVSAKGLELKVFNEAVANGDADGMRKAAETAEKAGGKEAQAFAHAAAATLVKGHHGDLIEKITPVAMRDRIGGEFRVAVDLPKGSITMKNLAGATTAFAQIASTHTPQFTAAYRARIQGDSTLQFQLRTLANMPDGPSAELRLSPNDVALAKQGAAALVRIMDFKGMGNMPHVDFEKALKGNDFKEMSKVATHAAGLDKTNREIFAREAVKELIANRGKNMPSEILSIMAPKEMEVMMYAEWNKQNPNK